MRGGSADLEGFLTAGREVAFAITDLRASVTGIAAVTLGGKAEGLEVADF